MATPAPVTTLPSALAVLVEAAKEITNAQTVLASETADDAAKTAALASAQTALTNANAQVAQFVAAIQALNLNLAAPVTGP